MKVFVRALSPFAAAGFLLLAAPLHAQVLYVTGGLLTVTAVPAFSSALAANGITMTYMAQGSKQGFQVHKGGVNSRTGAGSADTKGSITFAEGSDTVLLKDLWLSGSETGSYLSAEVYTNGADQGRFNVFMLGSDPFPKPTSTGEVSASAIKITINPAFVSEFADYIPISGFDPTSLVGSLNVTLTVSSTPK